nr:hypothetical protein GCM10020093_105570 [Planobispora longispora]
MTSPSELPISGNSDVVLIRQQVRTVAVEVGLSLVDQTKIVTAASELARNALVYAGGGGSGSRSCTTTCGRACA